MRLGLPSPLVRPAAPPLKWGLAAATSVARVLAFDYFHIPPVFAFSPVQVCKQEVQ
jgi:hypothetical protein